MDKIQFKDSTSPTPNRRRMKILENSNPLEMLVEIEHLEDGKDGDLVDAKLFQRLENNIYDLYQEVNLLKEENDAQSNTPGSSSVLNGSTKVYVNGNLTDELSFSSDPQSQLNTISNKVDGYDNLLKTVDENYASVVPTMNEVIKPKLNELLIMHVDNLKLINENKSELDTKIKNLSDKCVQRNDDKGFDVGDWKISYDSNSKKLVFSFVGK